MSSSKGPSSTVTDKLRQVKSELPSKTEVKESVVEAAEEVTKPALSGLRSFVAGGVGGICAVVIGL